MIPNDEKGVDPTVMTIVEMFSDDFLRDTARETGFVKRVRKIDPVILFWVLTLGFGVRFLDTSNTYSLTELTVMAAISPAG